MNFNTRKFVNKFAFMYDQRGNVGGCASETSKQIAEARIIWPVHSKRVDSNCEKPYTGCVHCVCHRRRTLATLLRCNNTYLSSRRIRISGGWELLDVDQLRTVKRWLEIFNYSGYFILMGQRENHFVQKYIQINLCIFL